MSDGEANRVTVSEHCMSMLERIFADQEKAFSVLREHIEWLMEEGRRLRRAITYLSEVCPDDPSLATIQKESEINKACFELLCDIQSHLNGSVEAGKCLLKRKK